VLWQSHSFLVSTGKSHLFLVSPGKFYRNYNAEEEQKPKIAIVTPKRNESLKLTARKIRPKQHATSGLQTRTRAEQLTRGRGRAAQLPRRQGRGRAGARGGGPAELCARVASSSRSRMEDDTREAPVAARSTAAASSPPPPLNLVVAIPPAETSCTAFPSRIPSPPASSTPKEEAAARIGGSAPASPMPVALNEMLTTLSVQFVPVSNLLQTALKRFTRMKHLPSLYSQFHVKS